MSLKAGRVFICRKEKKGFSEERKVQGGLCTGFGESPKGVVQKAGVKLDR